MKIEQYSRLLLHRVTGQGAVFTVPTSNDHTDETWSETDLYIGELGINVTDDTIWMRTNNGIVQIATWTASGAGGSASNNIWILNGSNEIELGGTYSPTAVVRNNNSFVDLGSSSLRFKDLYLGGASDGKTIINTNLGFTIRDSVGHIITMDNFGSNTANITIATQSSTALKTRPLHIQSQTSAINEFGSCRAIIGSYDSFINGSFRTVVIAGNGVIMGTNSNNSAYLGVGYGKEFDHADSVGVGGTLRIRGVDDDGSTNYNESDRVYGQTRLTTSNALTTPIFSWTWDPSCGEVFSGEWNITGVDVIDPSRVYSVKLLWTGSFNGVGWSIGDPIIQEVNSMDSDVEAGVTWDNVGFDITVKGEASTTIKWLCSYNYHRIINVC